MNWAKMTIFLVASGALAACSPPGTTGDNSGEKEPAKTDVPALAAPVAMSASTEPVTEFNLIAGDGIFAMIVDPKSEPASWRAAAKAQCGARDFCQVMGWTDRSAAATAIPMTDLEVETQVFQYNLNRNSGRDRTEWNCDALAQAGIKSCPASVGE